MVTQITVQARQLRQGDALVGSGSSVAWVRAGVDGWIIVGTIPNASTAYRPTEHVRVAREVRS